MARRIAWTEAASIDLEEAWEYIAHDSLMYAASFVQRIRDSARSLAELPERGRVVPEFELPSVRELIVGNYRLVFQTTPTTIFILRVIHGARRMPPLDRDDRN